MKVIAVERRDGIRMRDEIVIAGKRANHGFAYAAGRNVVLGVCRVRIDTHDNEQAEGFDSADLGRRSGGKAQLAADVSLNLALPQLIRGLLWSDRPDVDLMRIERRIDRQLVPAARHAGN